MRKQVVIETIKKHQIELWEGYNISSLSLFGSVARNEAGPESDVDLLVEFNKPIGLFKFIELKNRLEELLDCNVDLGTPRSLKLYLKEEVMEESIRVA